MIKKSGTCPDFFVMPARGAGIPFHCAETKSAAGAEPRQRGEEREQHQTGRMDTTENTAIASASTAAAVIR